MEAPANALVVGGSSTASIPTSFSEGELLLRPDRLHLQPIQYPDLWKFYKDAEAAFWTSEEVDFGGDKKDFDGLKEEEQNYISYVLAFFAVADALVFDNIDTNFGAEIQIREAKSFYAFQKTIEGIHNEVYSAMIENLLGESRRKEVLDSASKFPAIIKKREWALEFTDPTRASFGTRILAFIIMEYLFFSASFASIFFFKKRGKMNGLCFSNELISRDEGLHAQFGCLLYNSYLNEKPSQDTIDAMVTRAVEIETEFVTESLPVRLLGMNSTEMTQYVHFVADHMLQAINQPKKYNVENPFSWMEIISLQGKTNFFEKRVGEYSKAGVGAPEEETFTFSTSADF
jgi:ribonucleotide reductase beta subunit family protein with ferritin-like domain